MEKKTFLMSTIELFESGKTDLTETIKEINHLTGKNVDEYSLRNYWSWTSLEDFCNTLLIEPIYEWESIDDKKALRLIKEILENITNNGILERNGDALEKKYRKTTGFLSNLIFYSNIDNEVEILKQLKRDTTIYL